MVTTAKGPMIGLPKPRLGTVRLGLLSRPYGVRERNYNIRFPKVWVSASGHPDESADENPSNERIHDEVRQRGIAAILNDGI